MPAVVPLNRKQLRGVMEGNELCLLHNLIKKPEEFLPHHFSLPRRSIVIAVEQVDAVTTRKNEVIHNESSPQKRTTKEENER